MTPGSPPTGQSWTSGASGPESSRGESAARRIEHKLLQGVAPLSRSRLPSDCASGRLWLAPMIFPQRNSSGSVRLTAEALMPVLKRTATPYWRSTNENQAHGRFTMQAGPTQRAPSPVALVGSVPRLGTTVCAVAAVSCGAVQSISVPRQFSERQALTLTTGRERALLP
jgi:hypothetical protein